MKGDFSRKTFNKKKHYSSVRMQQGRVQLDADWNEQMDIWAHRIQTETQDFIGISGTPDSENEDGGFKIVANGANLEITSGRYYVNGLLCEKEAPELLTKQSDYPGLELPNEAGKYLIYLDVWQHHITGIEDPEIKEPALKGADTTTRVKNLAQVKWAPLTDDAGNIVNVAEKWKTLTAPSNGKLKVQVRDDATLQDQLYRVEIHKGGSLGEATFKWTRNNGSTLVKVEGIDGDSIVVSRFNQSEDRKFEIGDWLELKTMEDELKGEPGIFVRIKAIQEESLEFKLKLDWFGVGLAASDKEKERERFKKGTARLWNINSNLLIEKDDCISIRPKKIESEADTLKISGIEKVNTDDWFSGQFVEFLDGEDIIGYAKIESINNSVVSLKGLTSLSKDVTGSTIKFCPIVAGSLPVDRNSFIHLEDGLQIKFSGDEFKSCDYWMIPTRATSDTVNWSDEAQSPDGIKHHYAKLALVEYEKDQKTKTWTVVEDYRAVFSPITSFKQLTAITAGPNAPSGAVKVDNKGDVAISGSLSVGAGEENHISFKGEIKTGRPSGFVKMAAPLRISIGASADKKMPHLSLENPETRKEWRIYNGFKSDDVLSIYNNANKKPCLTIDTSGSLEVTGTVNGRNLEEDGNALDNIMEAVGEVSQYDWGKLKEVDQNVATTASPAFAGLKVSNKVCVTSEGNIGIGTDNPQARLHIEDGGDGEQKSFMIGNGDNQVFKKGNRLKVPILQLGDNWTLSGIGDNHNSEPNWIRLSNADNRDVYFGGFAADKLHCTELTVHEIRCSSTLYVKAVKLQKNSKEKNSDDELLKKLCNLNVVFPKSERGNMDSEQPIGLIAGDVEDAFPQLVCSMSELENNDEILEQKSNNKGRESESKAKSFGINYIGLIPVIIESIKELKQQFEEIRKEMKKFIKKEMNDDRGR